MIDTADMLIGQMTDKVTQTAFINGSQLFKQNNRGQF